MLFEPLANEAYWLTKPQIYLLDDSRMGPYSYFQDTQALDIIQGKKTEARDNVFNRYISDDDKQNTVLMHRSVRWPLTAFEDGSSMPFITAALTSFFAVPAIDPAATAGTVVLAGYFAGVLANYMIIKRESVILQEYAALTTN